MRRRHAILLVLALLLFASVFPQLAAADSTASQTSVTGTVKAGNSVARVRSGPGTTYAIVGRLNTGATVNVLETLNGQSVDAGNAQWYRIGDGRYIYSGLVRTSAPVTPPVNPPAANAGKWIEVILSQHKLIAWDGDTAAMTTIVAIGKPSTPTVKGTFHIYAKYKVKDLAGPGYYQPRVPNAMFFYGGYSIHGTYWHRRFGQNVSHGCVNVNLTDAEWLYNWTPMATRVVVHN